MRAIRFKKYCDSTLKDEADTRTTEKPNCDNLLGSMMEATCQKCEEARPKLKCVTAPPVDASSI